MCRALRPRGLRVVRRHALVTPPGTFQRAYHLSSRRFSLPAALAGLPVSATTAMFHSIHAALHAACTRRPTARVIIHLCSRRSTRSALLGLHHRPVDPFLIIQSLSCTRGTRALASMRMLMLMLMLLLVLHARGEASPGETSRCPFCLGTHYACRQRHVSYGIGMLAMSALFRAGTGIALRWHCDVLVRLDVVTAKARGR
ncbi:hypothetical protein CC85DRAFT_3816 [Cutaneotrichosporon oleaginosum]|uniref:Uncharacterized protein n=1 Tax=Cutaneotrichosporon oleaginosum TaxID=879819 RepID=A0A0J0XZP7_9TREE|nr:uncharacterized protein CC85DRAFT_3816 [Cutaneotrichosporon oleaginosum]KLT46491.1 hypothetical protein CC85DRAFT_3816 [Cutaneotrichosporon oleaginosum]TXT15142.1 hypothetical protein COLE_01335 [Cutaneotrichosporon oleaginosum]